VGSHFGDGEILVLLSQNKLVFSFITTIQHSWNNWSI